MYIYWVRPYEPFYGYADEEMIEKKNGSIESMEITVKKNASVGSVYPDPTEQNKNGSIGSLEISDRKKYTKRVFLNNDTISLTNDSNIYFNIVAGKIICFTIGTNINKTLEIILEDANIEKSRNTCHCLEGYYGDDCGIPDVAWHSRFNNAHFRQKLKRRRVPRRVINGIPMLNESDLIETRLHELGDVVDVFLFAESNYSAHGDPKRLFIRDRLHKGFVREYHRKILHVFADFFPELGKTDNNFADYFLRVYMGNIGLPRIHGLKDDDLFIINDADELPSRELVTFLKLYDGYTVPIALIYRWSIYGFFWKNRETNSIFGQQMHKLQNVERTQVIYSVGFVGILRDVMDDNPFLIRDRNALNKEPFATRLYKYSTEHPNLIEPWIAGDVGHYAGWHCSWCFK